MAEMCGILQKRKDKRNPKLFGKTHTLTKKIAVTPLYKVNKQPKGGFITLKMVLRWNLPDADYPCAQLNSRS